MINNKVTEFLKNRRSIKDFTDEPVSEEQIAAILESGRWAPSWLKIQPWKFIVIDDPKIRANFTLSAAEQALLDQTLPASSLLADLDLPQLWSIRKQRVFKPVDSFGSKGVLLGTKISRTRFEQLPVESTLVQELVPPSLTEVPGCDPMKTDLRLYAYRDRPLGVTARLYRGQVTNLRTPGGGFATVKVV